ncbi:cell wall-binding repeat-containing protein [Salinibacterium sp. M195]|uniref:cell wall-binding repeat-containing protein n=1 Tax=Salinibacterium sp. M195 TaxID=2583374 RepID=UPI002105B3D2|nr:cell wall-binding repeat-containing protein [Salinibacterium sp. M195]
MVAISAAPAIVNPSPATGADEILDSYVRADAYVFETDPYAWDPNLTVRAPGCRRFLEAQVWDGSVWKTTAEKVQVITDFSLPLAEQCYDADGEMDVLAVLSSHLGTPLVLPGTYKIRLFTPAESAEYGGGFVGANGGEERTIWNFSSATSATITVKVVKSPTKVDPIEDKDRWIRSGESAGDIYVSITTPQRTGKMVGLEKRVNGAWALHGLYRGGTGLSEGYHFPVQTEDTEWRLVLYETPYTERAESPPWFVRVYPVVTRLAGANRYATAAAVSAASFEPGVSVAYVANGSNFPDALAGAAVAGKVGAPVLLTSASSIPAVVKAELVRLKPQRIVVLGGSGVVSNSVLNQLGAFTKGGVSRLAGANRYATAAAVSAASFEPGVSVAYVANGSNFPDALAGAAVAGKVGAPVLLTSASSIPAVVKAELVRLKPQRIVVLGGSGVISASLEKQLKAYAVP